MTPDENPLVDRAERLGTLTTRLGVQLSALDDQIGTMNGTGIYRDDWEPTPYALEMTRDWCERIHATAEALMDAMGDLERATATMVVWGRGL